MEKRTYDVVDETVYVETLPNGMQVFLMPKPEMSKTFGIFMTNYGSIDRKFMPAGKGEAEEVPDGVAHFLEHKLFEKEDRDVFQDFLNLGASPNAYTSFTKTAYLFSATDNEEANVGTLLDFVQDPYFSDTTVEKEKGIIEQEIKMYDDQSDWQAFMGAIKNMYAHHPVKIDIAGTVPSITDITKEDLYTCYNTFYNPANMVLFVIGNFEAEAMMQTVRENQASKTFPDNPLPDHMYPEEPKEVAVKERTIHMPVTMPKVTIGIKETNGTISKDEFLMRDTMQTMLLDYLFDNGGPFYEELYEAGLIDDSFSFSTTVEEAFSFSLLSGNTNEPEKFAKELKALLLRTNSLKLDEETFLRMKKKQIGQQLRAMNSLEYIANQFVHYYFIGLDFFDVISYMEALTLEEVQKFLNEWIEDERLTVSIIRQEERAQ